MLEMYKSKEDKLLLLDEAVASHDGNSITAVSRPDRCLNHLLIHSVGPNLCRHIPCLHCIVCKVHDVTSMKIICSILSGVLVHLKGQHQDKIAVLLNVNHAKFRNPVRPGDVLYLKCTGVQFSSKGGKVHAEALVNDKTAAEAEIGFALIDKSLI